MTVNKALVPVLETAIKENLKVFESNNEGNSLGDLYLSYDEKNAVLSVYDDMENLLNEVQLSSEPGAISETLRYALQKLEQEDLFNKPYITKPFTVSLVDEDIWNRIDKELDDFLKDLMK
jgi:hypothetical protein